MHTPALPRLIPVGCTTRTRASCAIPPAEYPESGSGSTYNVHYHQERDPRTHCRGRVAIVCPAPVARLFRAPALLRAVDADRSLAAEVCMHLELSWSDVIYLDGVEGLSHEALQAGAASVRQGHERAFRPLVIRRRHYDLVVSCAPGDLGRVLGHLMRAAFVGGGECARTEDAYLQTAEFRALVLPASIATSHSGIAFLNEMRTRRVEHPPLEHAPGAMLLTLTGDPCADELVARELITRAETAAREEQAVSKTWKDWVARNTGEERAASNTLEDSAARNTRDERAVLREPGSSTPAAPAPAAARRASTPERAAAPTQR